MIFNLLDVQLPNFEQIIDLSPSDSTDSSQSKPIIDLKPKKIAVSHDFQVKYKTEVIFLAKNIAKTRHFLDL